MAIILLTQAIIPTLTCPAGQRRIEYCDKDLPGLLLEVRASGASTYYLRYKSDGQTKYVKLSISSLVSLAQARAKAKKLKAEIALGACPRSEANAKKAALTVDELWTNYFAPYKEPRIRSFARYEQIYRIYIKPKLGHLRLHQVSRLLILAAQTELVAKGLSPASCDHVVKLAKGIFNYAIFIGVFEGINPAKVPLLHISNTIERYLDEESAGRLLAVLQTDHNRPICLLIQWLLATGMRLGASLALRWEHVNREQRSILTVAKSAKSGRASSLPMNDLALAVLDQLQTEGVYDFLFVNTKTAKPFVNVSKVWHRLRTRAGLGNFRLHDGRHSFASSLANQGVSLYVIQALLQHRSPITTQRYSHLSSATLLNASNSAASFLKGALQNKVDEIASKSASASAAAIIKNAMKEAA